jgi:hypothetical protein
MKRMKKLMSAEAKQIDLVNYLAALGHYPKKINNKDYWYLSPFREEKTPYFKINGGINAWYDHGIGKGGNLVDFGILYFNCSVSNFLEHLSEYQTPSISLFHQPSPSHNLQASATSLADEKKEPVNNDFAFIYSFFFFISRC